MNLARPIDLEATAKAAARILAVGTLTTPEDAAQAAAMLRALHQIRSEGEGARKAAKAPHLDAGRAVDASYRPALVELDRVIGMLKERLAERALAQDEARLRAFSAPPEEANIILSSLEDENHERVYHTWTWEIESVNLSHVPVEYLLLNESAVKAEIRRSTKEARRPSIPGMTFKRKVTTTCRRTRHGGVGGLSPREN